MTINLKPTKETRLILRAYLVPTSVPVKAESWFLKTACRILHTGICYMSRQKIQLWLRGPAVFSGAGFFSVMLGNGTDANCSFRQCLFLGWAERGGREQLFFPWRGFFALHPHPFLLEEQSQHCFLEMPFAYPSQVLTASSLVSSTTIWQFPKPLCEELRSSKRRSSKQSGAQSVSVLPAITSAVCQAPSTPSYPS